MLKMNELSSLTNTPKSTILYYIKEGLLPEPHKDKPNFHLYDENNIQLIEFIKYLQTNFSASISQIKSIFEQPEFDLSNPYKSLTHSLHLIIYAESERFTPSELCDEFGITEIELNELIDSGLINPRNGIFTKRERDMLAIISRCDGPEYQLIQQYAEIAKVLAHQEIEIGMNILNDSTQQSERLKHFFDLLLLLKPYMLNQQTFNAYQQKTKV